MKKTAKLQELFHRGKIFVIPGGGCALHARIAEAVGYECAYMSGANTVAHILGLPDASLITMTEMAENAKRMANCISILLSLTATRALATPSTYGALSRSSSGLERLAFTSKTSPFPSAAVSSKARKSCP